MVYLANPTARVSVIAHSFGTFIISQLLETEFDIRFHRVIFCGSVVSYNFPLENFRSKLALPLLNEVGTADIWPAIAESITFGYGSAGSYGFRRPYVRDRWHNGASHGFFLTPSFAKDFWVPFLESGIIIPGSDPAEEPSRWVKLISIFKIKYLFIAAIATSAVPYVMSLISRIHL